MTGITSGGTASTSRAGPSIDIGRVLDDGPYTRMQKIVVLLAALSIVMDGFDGQLIGFAIPVLIKEWGITRSAFAPAVAAGLVGMLSSRSRFLRPRHPNA